MKPTKKFCEIIVSIQLFKNIREMSAGEDFKYVDNLPDEVLLHVFEFLSKESLLQCCLVQKR